MDKSKINLLSDKKSLILFCHHADKSKKRKGFKNLQLFQIKDQFIEDQMTLILTSSIFTTNNSIWREVYQPLK